MGWRLDEGAMAEIDRIVAECVPEPIGPEFMAPSLKRPAHYGVDPPVHTSEAQEPAPGGFAGRAELAAR